jgi:hypothetical protein
MFGAVPAEWLYELAQGKGIMIQMDLDLPRHYIIDEEFKVRKLVLVVRLITLRSPLSENT